MLAGDVQTETNITCDLSITLDNIKIWMHENRLKMNDSKTEFIIFGGKRALQKSMTTSIRVGEATVQRSANIKLLGLNIDEHLDLKYHIACKARCASMSLFNLKKLSPHLTEKNRLKLVNALVFSHMDYCNSLFINLPKHTLKPFQRIQNFAAKIVLGKSKYSSSTEALKHLHMLPVHVRCEFKLLVMVYKCLHGIAPTYLAELLHKHASAYCTRRSRQNLLDVPFTRKKTFADRSFSVAGPKLWNDLPENITSIDSLATFKKALKTYLFKRTFQNP